jgi:transposase
MNTKLHAVTDTSGRPIRFFITAGQISDYTGAAALLNSLPDADWLLADRGYDADWFREALKDKGIRPCIPGRKSRSKAIRYDKRRYRRRNRIERMFGECLVQFLNQMLKPGIGLPEVVNLRLQGFNRHPYIRWKLF